MKRPALRYVWIPLLLMLAALPLHAQQNAIDTVACDSLQLGSTTFRSSTTSPVLYRGHYYNVIIHRNKIGNKQRRGICDSMLLEDGRMVSTLDSFHVVIPTVDGCDSIYDIVINEIQHSVHRAFIVDTCDYYNWPRNGFTYTYSTNDVYDYNVDLCHNADTLHLTLHPSWHDTVVRQSCNQYTWSVNGVTYDASGHYVHQAYTQHQCDSIHNLVLFINNTYNLSRFESSCQGVPWYHNSRAYYEPAILVDSLFSTENCDSVMTFHFNVDACNGNANAGSVSCSSYITRPATPDTTIYLSHPSTYQLSCTPGAAHYRWSPGNLFDDSTMRQPTVTLYPDSTLHIRVTTFTIFTHELFDPILQADTLRAPAVNNRCIAVAVNGNSHYSLSATYLPVGSTTWRDTSILIYNASASQIALCPAQILGRSVTSAPSLQALTHLSLRRLCISRDTVIIRVIDGTSRDTVAHTACNSYTWRGRTLTQSGLYVDTADVPNHLGCDSILYLQLTMGYDVTTNVTENVCESFSISDGTTYTQSGSYQHHLQTSLGCDSLLYLNLTIRQGTSDTTQVNVTSCDSYYWPNTDSLYHSSTHAMVRLLNSQQCDSVVNLNLTVNYSTSRNYVENVCDSFRWEINQQLYTQSLRDTVHLTNALQCDSVNYLTLHVRYSTVRTDTVNRCDSYRWPINGSLYTTSTRDTAHLINTVQCDSINLLYLTIRYSSFAPIYQPPATCDSFLWSNNGRIYRQSGTYYDTTINVHSCDSIATMQLTIFYSDTTHITLHACDSMLWHNRMLYHSDEYVDTFSTVHGCDSLTWLHLHVGQTATAPLRVEDVCDSFVWDANQIAYHQAGIYYDTIQTYSQCDSMISLSLTVRHRTADTTQLLVDSCDRYTWNITGQTYTLSDILVASTPNNQQCDSVLRLQLTVRHASERRDSLYVCDAYHWIVNDSTYRLSSRDTILSTNAVGCDSVNYLNLSVGYSSTAATRLEDVCDLFTWDANHQSYTQSGIYLDTILNRAQCDSAVSLNLSVRYSSVGYDTARTCDSILWNSLSFYRSGNYSTHLTNSVQCDSLVHLSLSVFYSTVHSDHVTVCDTYRWPVNGLLYTQSINDTAHIFNAVQCDSLNYLFLTVHYSTADTIVRTACEQFYWSPTDTTYTCSAVSSDTLRTIYNCDSVMSLHLTMRYPASADTFAHACDTFVWHGYVLHDGGATERTRYFSVSTSSRVYFAPGNLQYNPAQQQWRFASQQYERLGSTNRNISATYSGWIDLFGWGTSGWNSGASAYRPYDVTVTNAAYRPGNNAHHSLDSLYANADWGVYNTISNAPRGTHWRTLATNEWRYLITERPNAQQLRSNATVNGHCGLLILPDNFVLPDSITYVGNAPSYYINVYSRRQWDSLEAAGAAFLPATGYRAGVMIFDANTAGNYWSSTRGDNERAYYLGFQNSGIYVGTTQTQRSYGLAVRLVRDTLFATVADTLPLAAANGCDSVIRLKLTISPTIQADTFRVEACNSYTWYINDSVYTYTQSGIYYDTLINSVGCDSVFTLLLTMHYSDTTRLDSTKCDSSFWHGNLYTLSGIYSDTLATIHQCDSLVFLNLTVNYSTSHTTSANVCDNYVWNDSTYYFSALDTVHLLNALQCDSADYLNLTVRHSSYRHDTIELCDSYRWPINDSLYTATTHDYYLLQNAVLCDSNNYLHLTVHYSDTTRLDSTKCDSFFWHGSLYAFSGIYSDTLATIHQCDSLVFLNLTVNYSTSHTTSADICDSYVWNGRTYYFSALDTVHLRNAVQCDSADYLNLTVRHSSYRHDTIDSCDSYRWFINDSLYTTSTHDYHLLQNAVLCDSNNYLHLTVRYSTYRRDTVTRCDTYTWPVTDSAYTGSLSHYVLLPNSVGCDSNNYLNLTIHYSTLDTTHVYRDSCDRFYWAAADDVYTLSGNYHKLTANQWGCDSNLLLHLTVRYSSELHQYDTACDSYQWYVDRNTYTTTSSPVYHTTNAVGCDSAVTLHLVVYHSDTSSLDTFACGRILWNGDYYNQSGSYYHRFLTTRGCDSVAWLHFTLQPSSYALDTVVACNRYTWPSNGQTYTASTFVTDTARSLFGCDSVRALLLTIYPSYAFYDTASACDNYRWIVNHKLYIQSGRHSADYHSQQGCDSSYHLCLTLHYSAEAETTLTACDSYTWHEADRSFSSSGHYLDTIPTAAGCDSIVTLHLTILKSRYTEYSGIICQGDTFAFGNESCLLPGTYIHKETAANGCDSVSMLFLEVLPYFLPNFKDSAACDVEVWHLMSNSGAPYLLWTAAGDETSLNGQEHNDTVQLTPRFETTYTLLVDYSDTGTCPATYSKTLRPIHRVDAYIETSSDFLTYDVVEFKATAVQSGADSLYWLVDEMQEFNSSSFVYAADNRRDSAIVVLHASNEYCADSDTVVLPIYKAQLFVPTVFTPGEQTNNRFGAVDEDILEFEIWIYNRQGLLVFHATDINDTWDGTHNGSPCPQAAYVYTLRYKDRVDPLNYRTAKGTVTLLR